MKRHFQKKFKRLLEPPLIVEPGRGENCCPQSALVRHSEPRLECAIYSPTNQVKQYCGKFGLLPNISALNMTLYNNKRINLNPSLTGCFANRD